MYYVFTLNVFKYDTWVQGPLNLEEGIRYSGAGIIAGYKLPGLRYSAKYTPSARTAFSESEL